MRRQQVVKTSAMSTTGVTKSGDAASDNDEGDEQAATRMSATTRAKMRATIEREDKQGMGQFFETKQTQQPTTAMTLQEGGMRHLGWWRIMGQTGAIASHKQCN